MQHINFSSQYGAPVQSCTINYGKSLSVSVEGEIIKRSVISPVGYRRNRVWLTTQVRFIHPVVQEIKHVDGHGSAF
jgi:hypothetical protein